MVIRRSLNSNLSGDMSVFSGNHGNRKSRPPPVNFFRSVTRTLVLVPPSNKQLYFLYQHHCWLKIGVVKSFFLLLLVSGKKLLVSVPHLGFGTSFFRSIKGWEMVKIPWYWYLTKFVLVPLLNINVSVAFET